MIVLDPGHRYELRAFDGEYKQVLTFMKRRGPGYPGNDSAYPGTNCQEVLRALIERVQYLDWQIAAPENAIIIAALRSALMAFEIRAARRHGRELEVVGDIETAITCDACGHVGCKGGCHS